MNLSIIGGDYRTVKLIELLAEDKHLINIWGFDECQELKNISNHNIILDDNISKVINCSDIIIGPVPLSKDKKHILSEYTKNKLTISEFKNQIHNKLFLAGNIPDEFINTNNCIDLLKDEELTIANAIATAEGTIEILMKNTLKTLFSSNILIIGYGRIGKILSDRLKGFKANVFCSARGKDLNWIKANGLNSVGYSELDEMLSKFDYIINTVPVMILDKERLKLIKQNTLIIDVASNPGGIDFEAAKKLNLKVLWELGIPGKMLPISAAKYLKETIYKTIKNRGENK